jgi:hypothetical protein
MSFASEFYRDEGFNYGNAEETISFVIENYTTLMNIHLEMKEIEARYEERAEEVLDKIEMLRDNYKKIKSNKRGNKTFQELMDIEYQIDELNKELDEGYIIDLEYDELSYFVFKHRWFFKALEPRDKKIRALLGKATKKTLHVVFIPLRTVLHRMMKFGDPPEHEKEKYKSLIRMLKKIEERSTNLYHR